MNAKIIAIAVVAIMAVAGIAAVAVNMNNGNNDSDTVTITDSNGNEVKISLPIERVCILNLHVGEYMHIMGVSDKVVSADSSTISMANSVYGDVINVGDNKKPTSEMIISSTPDIVIYQPARPLSDAMINSLKSNGIQVVTLGCYGETMDRDAEELSKLFGDDAKAKLTEFFSWYDAAEAKILSSAESIEKGQSFLFYFASLKKYYNANSEVSVTLEGFGAVNALTDMGIEPGSGVTSSPSAEAIYDYGHDKGIDVIILRSSDGKTLDAAYESFIGSGGQFDYNELNAVKNHKVFVINTNALAGPRGVAGLACMVEALLGSSPDVSADDLMAEYNEKFGFKESISPCIKSFGA